ncbi:MAG: ABC transporter ATP-binding protein [Pseudomonadota bacterium]
MSGLSVSGLSVSLGRRQIISDLSYSFEPGTFCGLIGPNGSGKSTLLKAIMGLLTSAGTVAFDGHDLRQHSAQARAKLLAYLPQDGEIVWPIAVEDLVMLGRAPYRSGFAPPGERDLAAVAQALTAMDLDDKRTRSAKQLSGGEQARVLIARALAQETPVLIADEPTAGLDPAHQIALMETLRDAARAGRTVIASLHELALAAQWCDRLVLLQEGAIVASGQPCDVLTAEALASVYGVEAHFATSSAGPVVLPIARV